MSGWLCTIHSSDHHQASFNFQILRAIRKACFSCYTVDVCLPFQPLGFLRLRLRLFFVFANMFPVRVALVRPPFCSLPLSAFCSHGKLTWQTASDQRVSAANLSYTLSSHCACIVAASLVQGNRTLELISSVQSTAANFAFMARDSFD